MKNFRFFVAAALLGATTSVFAQTSTLTSIRLTDAVDKGIGNINLLKNVTAPQADLLRQDNNGVLSFGVDVNEAANGAEKATSQGVAVQSAKLVVVTGGVTREYTSFFTETETLLAVSGSTTRQAFYTLLGESGSSRITSNNAIQDVFDSTLKVRVPDSIASATSITLQVRFVDTNVKLGDGEAFYDFTAGFEDLALLNQTDTAYLDVTLVTESVFRNESVLVELSPEGEVTASSGSPPPPTPSNQVYFPSSTTYAFSGFEDQFPNKGDYDFNDTVTSFQIFLTLNAQGQVTGIGGQAYLLARGAVRTHDWSLRIGLPGLSGGASQCQTIKPDFTSVGCTVDAQADAIVWKPFIDTRAIFPQNGTSSGSGLVNTQNKQDFQLGPKASFSITLPTPVAVPAGFTSEANYVPSLFVYETTQTIDINSRDENNWPYGAIFPNGWSWPLERVDTGTAYGELLNFVQSGGTLSQDWYTRPSNTQVHNPRQSKWEW